MSIPMTSEAYIAAAAEALEKSNMATHSPEAMRTYAYRAEQLMRMATLLAEREAADLTPPEPVFPAAFLDCHDRRWEKYGSGGHYVLSVGTSKRPEHISDIRETFGPLRMVEE